MYDISAIPTKILIDPEGKIVVKYVGDSAGLDRELEKIFKKQSRDKMGNTKPFINDLSKLMKGLVFSCDTGG